MLGYSQDYHCGRYGNRFTFPSGAFSIVTSPEQ